MSDTPTPATPVTVELHPHEVSLLHKALDALHTDAKDAEEAPGKAVHALKEKLHKAFHHDKPIAK